MTTSLFLTICDEQKLYTIVAGKRVYPEPSARAARIIAHYQSWLDQRGGSHYHQRHAVERCLADLAGANGFPDRDQRTEPRL